LEETDEKYVFFSSSPRSSVVLAILLIYIYCALICYSTCRLF